MRRTRAVLVAAFICGCALTGCGSDDDRPSNGNPAPAGERFSVETALRDLPPLKPDDDQALQVLAGGLTDAARLGKLPEPDDKDSTQAWLKGMRAPLLSVPDSEGLGFHHLQNGAMRKVLGFDARDVHTFAAIDSLPQEITVVRLSGGAKLKSGVTTTGAGKVGDLDPATLDDVPFPFIYGVVQQEDQIALGKTPDLLSDWKERGERSLADHSAFLEIAKALDAHHVYAAVLIDRPPEIPPMSAELVDMAQTPTVPAFDALGIAQGVERGKAVEYIAYHLDDAAQARKQIEQVWRRGDSFRGSYEPLKDLLDVEDVTVKGNVVTVKITPTSSPGLALDMLAASDTPFLVLD